MWRCKVLGVCLLLSYNSAANEDGSARVLQYEFDKDVGAQYRYSFETSNGIKRNESGDEIPSIHDENSKAALVKGSFSYTGADGVVYAVNYVADEAGFHPEGDHLKIPPFTPWIPGQPIDDGQYREDPSGDYKPDNSGKYRPEQGEGQDSPVLTPKQKEEHFISGERILDTFRTTPQPPTSVTQKYLPTHTPQKTNYVSGENILDTFLEAKTVPTTPKYLPASSSPSAHISGENILDTFRQSSRPTPKYLPSFPTESSNQISNFITTENPLSNDIIKRAFFNKPTPHPDILLNSTPNDAQIKGFPKPFGAASKNSPKYVKLPLPENDVNSVRKGRSFQYSDINEELRLLAGLI